MKKNLLLALLISTFALQIKAQCTFGNYPPSFTLNPGWTNGIWIAKKYNLPATATLTGLGLNAAATPFNVVFRMAVFTDASNMPGNFVAASAQGTMALGPNIVGIPTSTIIPAGSYWIVAIYGNSGVPTSSSASVTPFFYQSGSLTTPPASMSTWTNGGNYDIDYWAIINTPTVTINGPNSICLGSSATYTAGGGMTYTWSTGPTSSTISLTPTINTTYTVVTINASGCPGFTSFPVSVSPLPTLAIAGNSTVCPGAALSQTVSGALSYTWNTGANTNTILVSPLSNTIYAVNGTGSNGCIGNSSVSISTGSLPALAFTGNTAVCAGSSLSQTVSGALSYTWNTGATTNTVLLSPTSNTVYSVNGIGSNGCIGISSVSVTVNPLPILTASLSHMALCVGENGTISVNGVSSCTWNTGATGLALPVNPTITTSYTATGTDVHNCVNSVTVSQLVNLCTAIEKQQEDKFLISAYPNPGSGIFEIRTVLNPDENTTLEIFNYNGLLLKNETTNLQSTRLDLSSYANGLYYVIVRTNKSQSVIKLMKE